MQEFTVKDMSPTDVLEAAEVHYARQGYFTTMDSTDTTKTFVREPSCLAHLLTLFFASGERIKFVASADENGGTRLSLVEASPKRVEQEVVRFIQEELGGTAR
jgi:hypothetical protein